MEQSTAAARGNLNTDRPYILYMSAYHANLLGSACWRKEIYSAVRNTILIRVILPARA